MTRHMFAGGTTPAGFVNFFDQIMPLENAQKRYFLKGASGSGKSTFMKKIAAGFEAAGLDTDIYHCANDSDSLDGVSVKQKGLCIIDGTAPHVSDPQAPIAVDVIIDFAQFIDGERVSRYMPEIKRLLREKKLLTDKARGYFAAAGSVYSAERAACGAAIKKADLRALTREWYKIFDSAGTPGGYGTDRIMFLTAVTPDGVISFAETFLNGYKVYGLESEAGAGTDIFLAELKEEANARGINTESFYCPLDPAKIEYLALPELKTAFAVIGGHGGYKGHVDEIIDFDGCYDRDILSAAKSGIEEGGLLNALLDKTILLMKESRTIHSGIEKIYIRAMDFDMIDEMTQRFMSELLG